jgi:hypothetical protein
MDNKNEICKKGQFYNFPIITAIEYIDNKEFPIFHRSDGIARLENVKEVAMLAGWSRKQILIPVEIDNCEDFNIYQKSISNELFILNSKLILN